MRLDKDLTIKQINYLEQICKEEFDRNAKPEILPFKKLEKGIYFPSSLICLYKVLRKRKFRNKRRAADLGSGSGGAVFLLSLMRYYATGFEYNPVLFNLSKGIIKPRLISEGFDVARARFKRGDFLKEDFSKYDIIFYFDVGFEQHKELEDKLTATMKDDSFFLVYGQKQPFERLRLDSLWQRFRGHREGGITIYRKAK